MSEHQRAIRIIDDIPNRQYRSVGYHRVAVHAATAGNTALALTLLASIDDPVEKDEALKRIASAYIQSPEPTSLSALTDQLVAAGYGGIVPLARAAAGEIDNALADADALDDVFQRARLRIAIADTAVKTSQLAAARRIAEELIVEITRGAGAQWVLAPFMGSQTPEIQRTATLDLMQVLFGDRPGGTYASNRSRQCLYPHDGPSQSISAVFWVFGDGSTRFSSLQVKLRSCRSACLSWPRRFWQ